MKPILPAIRVTKAKAGTVPKPPQALDVQMHDLFSKVINNAGRLRARLDGCEARLEHLEGLLKRGYR
jgi:hypothetical protein